LAQNRNSPNPSSTSLTAGAAGAGGGTLLALLANNLSNSNPWKSWLVILAPSATVAVASLTPTVDAAVRRYLRKRELRDLVVALERTVSAASEYKDTDRQYLLQMQSKLGQARLALVEADVEKIKVLLAQR
jgi:hypothetical protein